MRLRVWVVKTKNPDFKPPLKLMRNRFSGLLSVS